MLIINQNRCSKNYFFLEPYFDKFAGGASMIKIFLNLIVAGILIPMERHLKKLFTGKKQEN
jgi:hypothetical protein